MNLQDFDSDLKAALRHLGVSPRNARILVLRDDILYRPPHPISNYAFDCGVFSALSSKQKGIYIEAAHKRIWTGGYLFLRCCADDLKLFEKKFHLRKQIGERFFILQCKR